MTTMAVNPMSALDRRSPNRPALRSFVITPSDANDLAEGCLMIYVGGAGDVKLTCLEDDGSHAGVVLKAVPAGTLLNVSARRVYATGTTATLLVGLG